MRTIIIENNLDTYGCILVSAPPGDIGGTLSHEYHILTPIGEDKLFQCSNCHLSTSGMQENLCCNNPRLEEKMGIEVKSLTVSP